MMQGTGETEEGEAEGAAGMYTEVWKLAAFLERPDMPAV